MNSPTIVVATIVTDRPDSLRRLIRSLHPLESDPELHVLVLDNSRDRVGRAGNGEMIRSAALTSRGRRVWVELAGGGAPLHQSRKQLVDALRSAALPTAIVWLVDDDVAFEALLDRGSWVERVNVAVARAAQIRSQAALGGVDVLVGGFTGDAPVRPDAVIGSQLADLCAELRRLGEQQPWSPHEPLQACRSPEDYYDHSEADSRSSNVPWLPSTPERQTVCKRFLDVCSAAAGLPRGSAPFRPLLEGVHAPRLVRARPLQGGNTVFFNRTALEHHPFPALELAGGWSRRADMVGAAMLCRWGYRVAADGPTLLHDRTGQAPLRADARAHELELIGALLARLVAEELEPSLSAARDWCLARKRRIADSRALAVEASGRAIDLLGKPDQWWHRHQDCEESWQALQSLLSETRRSLLSLTRLDADWPTTESIEAAVKFARRLLVTAERNGLDPSQRLGFRPEGAT